MSSIYDDLDDVIRRHRGAEEQAKRDTENAQRFDRLESSIGSLAESVSKLVGSSASPSPPAADEKPGGSTSDGPPPPGETPPAPPVPELPIQRVTRGSVPRVYTGDDEPSEVEYIDPDDGTTKKRPGRKKGHPTTWMIEDVEPEPPTPAEE